MLKTAFQFIRYDKPKSLGALFGVIISFSDWSADGYFYVPDRCHVAFGRRSAGGFVGRGQQNDQAQRDLSLSDALNLARQNQPTYRNYLVDEQLATKQAEATRLRMNPKVNGNVDGRGYPKRQTLVLPAFLLPGQTVPGRESTVIPQGTVYQLTASAELMQNVFDPTYHVDRQTDQLNQAPRHRSRDDPARQPV